MHHHRQGQCFHYQGISEQKKYSHLLTLGANLHRWLGRPLLRDPAKERDFNEYKLGMQTWKNQAHPGQACSLHYLSESETESVSHSLVSHSLQTHGLYTAKLFCPWNSPGKKTGVGRHSLLFTIWATREILEIAPIHVLWICNTLWPSQPLPPIFLLPSIFPNIRVFSNVLTLLTRWPKYWSFSFILSPSNEYSGLISFRIDWFDLLALQVTLKNLSPHHNSKSSFFST